MNKPEMLDRSTALGTMIEQDVAAERYDGAAVRVARGGDTLFEAAIGFADRAKNRKLGQDDVFLTFSIAKQFTHALILNRIDRGELALTTRVADVIPEFGCRGKQRIDIFHVLTHTGGLPLKLPMMDPAQMGNLQATVAATCMAAVESVPGERVYYSGIVGTAILAEVLRRLDGGKRAYRDILAQDLFAPLGMKDTALGLRPDLAARFCPVVARDRRPGISFAEEYEMFGAMVTADAEIPSLGCVTTANDLGRFAEMLRNGGSLDGARILSPAMVALAMRNHTGAMVNDTWAPLLETRGWKPWPAFLGLGFYLRGDGPQGAPFGSLASPSTFGGLGAGSTMFWIDPQRDLTFVFLSTGLITDESYNVERMQRVSDLVISTLAA
jgi:CubicO group peptidase (beta-lactamase class C family)